jgi:hypothetical protein
MERSRLSSCYLVALVFAVAACDKGLTPEPICAPSLVGICGTIHFRGAVPDSTDNVFVAAYATLPHTCDELIANRQPFIPASIPYTDSAAEYSVVLQPGTYEWVLAVWKKIGPLTLTPTDTALLRVAGYYRNPADSTQPGVVTVPSGGAAANIDFRAELDSLRPATDFVSCTAQ